MKQLAASGQLKTDDLVRKADQTMPVAAGDLQVLFSELQPTARTRTTPPPPLTSEKKKSDTADRKAMSKEWYYAKGDQKHGPITSERFRALAKCGALEPTDLVWTEGMTDWMKATVVNGLIESGRGTAKSCATAH